MFFLITNYSQQQICSVRPQRPNLRGWWCWREIAAWLETDLRHRENERWKQKAKGGPIFPGGLYRWIQICVATLVFAEVVPVLAGSGVPTAAAIQPLTELTVGTVVSGFAFVFFNDVYIWSLKTKIRKLKKHLKDLCYMVQDLGRLEQMLLCYTPWKWVELGMNFA